MLMYELSIYSCIYMALYKDPIRPVIEKVSIISLLFHAANLFSYLRADTMFGVFNCQVHYKSYYKLASSFINEYIFITQ